MNRADYYSTRRAYRVGLRRDAKQYLLEAADKARGVRSVAKGDMTSAAQSFQKASSSEQSEQAGELGKAGQSCDEAARRLDELARLAERLQRRSILEVLAAQAEQLAAYQKELRVATLPIAQKTAGFARNELNEAFSHALDGLVTAQGMISESVKGLEEGVEEAGRRLSFTSPAEAVVAKEALDTLKAGKALTKSKQIRDSMDKNVLLSKLPEQEQVEKTLLETAKVLRRRLDSDSMEGIMRTIEEFIRRQKEVIADITAAVDKTTGALKPVALGDKQSALERDVSEQASAIRWLAMEIELFNSATADKLDGAAGEMRAGSEGLYVSKLPDGLEHAQKALALLEESREKFKSEQSQMSSACQGRQSLEALLLLQQVLVGQKKVNGATAEADELRTADQEAFAELVSGLARRQGVLRLQADRLRAMLAQAEGAAQVVGMAGGKMDLSRLALEAGNAGKDTRVVQREIVALLEKLLSECQQCAGGMGLAGARAMAMAQMLQQVGLRPGGYAGGENAPILPATLKEAEDERWRVVRSRFEEELGAAFEGQYPLEFRDLLRAYFDRLREAPPE